MTGEDRNLISCTADWAFLWDAMSAEDQQAVIERLVGEIRRRKRVDQVASRFRPEERRAFVCERVVTLLTSAESSLPEGWVPPPAAEQPDVADALVAWVLAKPKVLHSEAVRFRAKLDGTSRDAFSLDADADADADSDTGKLEAEASHAGSRTEWHISPERRAIGRVDLETMAHLVIDLLLAQRRSPARDLAAEAVHHVLTVSAINDEVTTGSLVARERRAEGQSSDETGFRLSDHLFDHLLGPGWRKRPKDLARHYAAMDMIRSAAGRLGSTGTDGGYCARPPKTDELEQVE